MPAPLDPAKRAAILADVEAGEFGCNAIGRKHDVSSTTVSTIAREAGYADAFGRAQTKSASEARSIDMAAWRVQFAERMARRAERLDDRLEDMSDMSGRDARDFMTAVGIAVDKVGVLTRDDTQGLAAVDAWLRSVVGAETTA